MTVPGGGAPGVCASPIETVVLTDYWLGLLDPSDEEPVEEHLLACDACGHRLREVITLADGLQALARSGSLRVVVGDALVRHASGEGRHVREYTMLPGHATACTVAADDDLLVAHFAADLSGAGRMDLSLCDVQGVERQRMADIPIRADAAEVVYQESITFAKAAPTSSMVARLLAVDADGTERLVAEYTLDHTRTIPGPPGWETM